MKYVLSILLFITLARCNEYTDALLMVSSPSKTAESVYFTKDYKGNPVLVWTEKDEAETTLVYCVSADGGKSFSSPVRLPLDPSVATHAEGMPKVAFKPNGTIVVAYEKKAPTDGNKFAGFVCYRTSSDDGRSWSAERFLHRDTISGRSRSFFDIETLADGEVGASWLDIKLDNSTGGRSVRFAKTDSNNAFINEVLVDSSACQCCRTEVFADPAGSVNVAYRGLKKGAMGKTIRDMMIATSTQNGKAFCTPVKISEDNWNIDGCPHTGPALCSSKGALQALWYTEGSGTGIFSAHRDEGESNFNAKELVSNFGRHPQASANEHSSAIVWEENVSSGDKTITRIQSRVSKQNRHINAFLSPETSSAFLPVITQTKSGFIVAFLMDQDGETGVYVKRL